MLFSMVFLIGCGPKPVKTVAPPTGWHQEETWSLACYYPPEFSKFGEIERREARVTVMDAILNQWKGERSDNITVDSELVDDVERVLLSDMVKVEKMAADNLAKCQSVASNQMSREDWKAWIVGLPASLTEGECLTNFSNTILDTIEIDTDWLPSDPLPICGGDTILITASASDQYRIDEDGPWINVDGDQGKSTVGSELPCNTEGCFAGQLIMKFTSKDGNEEVYPVGTEYEFTATTDGVIVYGINDDTFFDNKWYISGGLQDHASITIKPN